MNIRHVRKKIKSIGNVKKITHAMQLVSAVKMRKAQEKAKEGMAYREGLDRVIKKVSVRLDFTVSPLLEFVESNRELIILISTNKGLCGAFNLNLFKFSLNNIDFKKTDFIIVGKKAVMTVNRLGGKVLADFSSRNLLLSSSAIFSFALEKFLDKKYKRVSLVYNKFISALKYEPTKEVIIPVTSFKSPQQINKFQETYTIEPEPELIIDSLLRSYIEQKIRGAIISSEAGEHSARMMAMKNATENATDLVQNLTLLRNKLRQEKITYELLDMVTAKESVEVDSN